MIRKLVMPLALAASAAFALLPGAASARTFVQFSVGGGYPYYAGYYAPPAYYYGPAYYGYPAYYYGRPGWYYREGWREHRGWDDHWRHERWEHHGHRGW